MGLESDVRNSQPSAIWGFLHAEFVSFFASSSCIVQLTIRVGVDAYLNDGSTAEIDRLPNEIYVEVSASMPLVSTSSFSS